MAWLRDLRYALRSIRRTAGLSIAVALTLVVGVCMNSVVVSLFNGLLFRPSADPLAAAAAVGLLPAAALIATAVPALRAASKDPWTVLKQ